MVIVFVQKNSKNKEDFHNKTEISKGEYLIQSRLVTGNDDPYLL